MMVTRVNSYSGLTVLEADGHVWHVCPYCNRCFTDQVEWCSHCELPPHALQASEWQEIPKPDPWESDQYDNWFTESEYDGGLGDPEAPGRLGSPLWIPDTQQDMEVY